MHVRIWRKLGGSLPVALAMALLGWGCGSSSSDASAGQGAEDSTLDTTQAEDTSNEVPEPESDWTETLLPSADLGDIKKKYTENGWFDFLSGVLQARFPAGYELASVEDAKEAATPYVTNQTDRYDHLMERSFLTLGVMCENAQAREGADGETAFVLLPRPGAPRSIDSTGVEPPPRSSIASKVPPALEASPFHELLLQGQEGLKDVFQSVAQLDCSTYGLLGSVVSTDLMTTDTALLDREQVMAELLYLTLYLRALRQDIPNVGAKVRGVPGFLEGLRDVFERAVWAVAQAKPHDVFLLATEDLEGVFAEENPLDELEAFLSAELP